MLGVDPEFGASLGRLWIAAGSAASRVVLCAVAFIQPQVRLAANPALRIGFVLAGAIFGAVMTWAFLDRAILGGAAAERRALELRAQQLSSQVLIPGSPLACLDALVGESVEAACEKSLFGSPAIVASSSAYVGGQLTLLANMTTFGQRQGIELEPMMAPLRRSLETDRFGFVAYVLAIRDGCTAQNCKTLSLFRDANRVRTNLTTAALERYLEHYAAAWSAGPEIPLAEATQAPTGSTPASGQSPRKTVNIDFPSASSIPAVSIMNPEPTGPVLPGVAAAAATNPNPSAPAQRHARKQSSPNPNTAAPNPTPRSPANRANRQSSRSGRSQCRRSLLRKPRRRQPHRPLHHPRRRPPVRFSSRRLPSMPVLVRLLAHSERGADHPLPLLARNVQLRPHCQPRRNCLPHRPHCQATGNAH